MSKDTLPHTPHEHDPADAWHSHTPDERPQHAHAEKVDVPMVLTYGVVGFGIIVVCIALTVVYFNWYLDRLKIEREERITTIRSEFDAARAQVLEVEFKQPAMLSAETRAVRIPLEAAKAKVVAEYGSLQAR